MPHPVVLRGAAASWGDRQLSYEAAHISIQQIADWITAEGPSSVIATQSGDPYALQAAVGALRRATNTVPWAKPAPAVAPSPAPMDTGDDGPSTPTPKCSAAPSGAAGRTPKLQAVPPGPARLLKAPRPDPPGWSAGDVPMAETPGVPVTTPTAGPQRPQPRPQPRKPVIPHQPPPLNLATKPRKSYAKAVAKAVVTPGRVRQPQTQANRQQAAAAPAPTPSPRKKKTATPDHVAPGPTRTQVLLEFTDGLMLSSVGGGLLGIYEYLNKQLGIEKFTTRLLSAGVAYKGYSFATSDVASDHCIDVMRGAIDMYMRTFLKWLPGDTRFNYYLGLPQSTAYLKIVDVPIYKSPLGGAFMTPEDYFQECSKSPLAPDITGALQEKMCPKRNSPASSNCTVFFDIWDSQTGT
ncbi:hypothetical protein HYPSUDRAFT_209935 [Hypholoma sublateritium FD-334 SS-4]|uniref:Uncharacterized protein n=1 Tax=Hypholoma sublateritium (strain FD-334 SS-4) TaxID=945553 RepID=A0A0D2N1A8_HYPSF|nr:hypothetical protein HYPSUDRAFT_209935 [Hypholoma sublateritium FD-334 SS-4]